MKLRERPIAITDLETTGLDPLFHEIIEIGLVVVRQPDWNILDMLEIKVKPEHPERITKEAVEVNGYNPKDWKHALDLDAAMTLYAPKVKNAMMAAHNITFDYGFIREAWRKTNIPDPMDYHRPDLWSIVWWTLRKITSLEKFNLKQICEYLGIPPEPKPHRALNGAMKELEVLKKLDAEFKITKRIP